VSSIWGTCQTAKT